MNRINIKPVSVNEAYTGRRFSTNKLSVFKYSVAMLLGHRNRIEIPEGNLSIKIVFGFSSKGSDLDNHLKTFLDCLQAKYKFNDNRIYHIDATKKIVKKGKEFIEFEITTNKK